MTTRNTSATPAPAPAPAPQSSESSQPAPTSSNPSPNAPVKTSDPPPPARLIPDAAAAPPPPSPAPFPTSSSPQSLPHRSSSEVPVSPPASTFGSPPLSTTTTDTSSTHLSSSTIRRTSTTNHHTADSQPSGAPYGIIGGSNESSNRIMLTVSLIVVFVILAGMGLVVYCLFRRRSAKRRMHLFGGNGSSKNTSGSLDSGIGSGGKRKSTTARRQSTISVGGGSIIGTGGKGDSMVTALAEMQEQQRRISDVDMSRDLQAMTEQHQNALMTRRTSTLSLGGLHHQNHHQHHLQQNQQHPGSRVVSPTLAPARPRSALAAGYWGGGGGPAGSADPTGEGTRRASMSGGGIVIGSGDYVAGPLGSSSDFRTTVYDDLYYPSRQFLYPSSGGGSSGASSNEQLLPPQHHHHPYYYSSGPPSSANMSRRSSLSPGTYPTHPSSENAGHGQNPSQIFRAKTIGTSNGHGYQQQMQYQQHYPPHAGPGPYRSTPPPHSSTPPPHLNRMSIHQPPATIASSSDDSSETTSNYPPSQQQQKGLESAGVSAGNSDTIPRSSSPLADPTRELQQQQHYPRRPNSMSMLQNNPPFTSPYEATVGPDRSRSPPPMSSSMGNLLDQNPPYRASYDGSSQLDIPPSITTRRRSMMPSALGPSGSPATSPGGGYLHQQGYPQQQHPYGGGGQDYFQDGQKYSVSPRSVSPYGYGNTPYQDHQHPNQYQYAKRSSTQLSRVPDQQGKSEYIQDGGEGVGAGKSSSFKTVSSSSSSSSGGTSNTASTAPTPTPTSLNLNSVRSKSPPPPQGWPGRSHVNGNSTGHGPIVHISPAP
ncbi:hypothetical protein BGZ89_005935 [Linnemannia elongata]|nr:hypothetical protein BGZ89_005935 [Linnemannia elongata]